MLKCDNFFVINEMYQKNLFRPKKIIKLTKNILKILKTWKTMLKSQIKCNLTVKHKPNTKNNVFLKFYKKLIIIYKSRIIKSEGKYQHNCCIL